MPYIGVSPQFGVRRVHTYTATASQTTFTGAGAEGATLSYKDSNFVDVYQNGVKLGDADYTATSGTSIVLGTGASASDLVVIVVFDVFSVADTVSKADGGTFDGDVTFAGAFTSQGIDDNANATAITIDSSENVMINTTNTNPAEGNVVGVSLMASNAISACDDGSAPIQLNRKTDDGAIAIFRKDGSAVGSIAANGDDLTIHSSVSGHSGFRFGAGEIYPTNNSGSLSSGTTSLGNSTTLFNNLYLSGGVYIGGTGSANYLDDYEEGTWTPTVDGGSSTYTTQYGFYTKIGEIVHAQFNITVNSFAGSVRYVMGGLPFTSKSTTGSSGIGTVTFFSNIHTSAIMLTCRNDSNNSSVYFSGATSSVTSMANINHNVVKDSTSLFGAIIYRAN